MTQNSDSQREESPLHKLYREKLMDAALATDPKEKARLRIIAEIFNPKKIAGIAGRALDG